MRFISNFSHLCDVVALEPEEDLVHAHDDVEVVLPVPADLVEGGAVRNQHARLRPQPPPTLSRLVSRSRGES